MKKWCLKKIAPLSDVSGRQMLGMVRVLQFFLGVWVESYLPFHCARFENLKNFYLHSSLHYVRLVIFKKKSRSHLKKISGLLQSAGSTSWYGKKDWEILRFLFGIRRRWMNFNVYILNFALNQAVQFEKIVSRKN